MGPQFAKSEIVPSFHEGNTVLAVSAIGAQEDQMVPVEKILKYVIQGPPQQSVESNLA